MYDLACDLEGVTGEKVRIESRIIDKINKHACEEENCLENTN